MTIRRLEVVLGLRMNDYAGLEAGARNVQTKMTANAAIFVSPNPSMAVLLQQIADYATAQFAVVSTRARGATQLRAVKRDVLWSSLVSERSCVQILCDNSPENAANIAASAGMRLFNTFVPHREILTAELTTTQGQVALKAAASLLVAPGTGKARARTYLWRFSIDGGKTFTNADPTPLAHTLVSGLPAGTLVGFQVAVKDGVGTSEWSQTTALLIH